MREPVRANLFWLVRRRALSSGHGHVYHHVATAGRLLIVCSFDAVVSVIVIVVAVVVNVQEGSCALARGAKESREKRLQDVRGDVETSTCQHVGTANQLWRSSV